MVKISYLLLSILVLSGCATPARQDYMVSSIDNTSLNSKVELSKQVMVESVSGGKETNPLWLSNVSSTAFKQALETSLAKLGILQNIPSEAKYKVNVELQNISKPIMGLNLEINSAAVYSVDHDKKKKIFLVNGLGSAGLSDEFAFNHRVRVANERSIKNNIENFIKQFFDYAKKN